MSEHVSTIRRMGTVALAVATAVHTAVLRLLAQTTRSAQTTHIVRPVRPSRGRIRARGSGLPLWDLLRPVRRPVAQDGAGWRARAGWQRAETLNAMPRQIVPSTDAIDLTPAERAAFDVLVRQFSKGSP